MASYSAVPSMLMVAPTGSMKRVTLASYPRFFSKHCIVTGNVAELESKREREKKENCKQNYMNIHTSNQKKKENCKQNYMNIHT